MRIKELISKFPESYVRSLSQNTKEDFYFLSYSEKFAAYNRGTFAQNLCVTNKISSIFICIQNLTPQRKGNTFFLESELISKFKIVDNKVSCDSLTMLQEYIFPMLKINWLRDLSNEYNVFILKPSILKSILLGNIYSEETLCKAILKRCYHCKELSWKSFRTYLPHCRAFPILDLMAFTKNVQISVDVLNNTQDLQIYYDLLRSAIELNEVVDFKWSQKRLFQEHQRQINILNNERIAAKSPEKLFPRDLSNGEFKHLNTELDLFKESLAMNNCLYHCYYEKIKNHKYLAFHYKNTTFGLNISKSISIDQIRGPYNSAVSEEIISEIEFFVDTLKF